MRQTVQAALGGDYQRMNSNKKKEEAEDAKLEMQMREIRQERVVTTRVVTSMLDKKKVVMHENVSVKQTYQKNNNVVQQVETTTTKTTTVKPIDKRGSYVGASSGIRQMMGANTAAQPNKSNKAYLFTKAVPTNTNVRGSFGSPGLMKKLGKQ